MTDTQQREQSLGPARPSVGELRRFLERLPGHWGIEAVSINGQTGTVIVELLHDMQTMQREFRTGNGPAFARGDDP